MWPSRGTCATTMTEPWMVLCVVTPRSRYVKCAYSERFIPSTGGHYPIAICQCCRNTGGLPVAQERIFSKSSTFQSHVSRDLSCPPPHARSVLARARRYSVTAHRWTHKIVYDMSAVLMMPPPAPHWLEAEPSQYSSCSPGSQSGKDPQAVGGFWRWGWCL